MDAKLQEVWDELEHVRRATLQRFEPLSQAQLDRRPPAASEGAEQGWSMGEVFMHIAIDEIYLRELLSRPLREGVVPPETIRFLPPPPPHELPKSAIRFWLERARLGTKHYLEEWPKDADERTEFAGGLGPMTSIGWLAGYAAHEVFHHRQIDALR